MTSKGPCGSLEGLWRPDHGRFWLVFEVVRGVSGPTKGWERRLARSEELLEAKSSLAAAILCDLAQVQERLGQVPEALECYQRALGIREELLGPHFYVASTLDALANLMDRQGSLSEAVAYGQQSLTVWEQVLGTEHLHVGRIVFNLAARRDQLGDRHGALEFYKRSFGIFESKEMHQERSFGCYFGGV